MNSSRWASMPFEPLSVLIGLRRCAKDLVQIRFRRAATVARPAPWPFLALSLIQGIVFCFICLLHVS